MRYISTFIQKAFSVSNESDEEFSIELRTLVHSLTQEYG